MPVEDSTHWPHIRQSNKPPFTTRSTKKEIRLEICSACHPLFTGKQKLIDSAGMVEKFQRRYGKQTKQADA